MTCQRFEAEGFTLLPGFVGTDELDALTSAIETVLALERPPCMQRPGNDLVPLRWNDTIVASILGNEHRIAALSRALGARDLKWISAYVSTKAPRSPTLWWHQDWWCWDHAVSYARPASQVALLCYPGATDTGTGALRLLPRSHHKSLPLHARLPEAHGDDANALAPGHPAMDDHAGQVTFAAQPGDAIVIDYRLLHGTHPNAASSRRDCVLLSFTPEWNALPDDIKAHLAMHPALPFEAERDQMCTYGHLLPAFNGEPRSLNVNRNAPAVFASRRQRPARSSGRLHPLLAAFNADGTPRPPRGSPQA
jgi:ectoine hydroxylase-related dioxygenase (phytanoyl-CoA dioxygenase family)